MRSKKVVVVGGGISGLAAANELLAARCQVTLIEATSRLGGRIHTNHDSGFPVELGAEFLHGKHEGLLKFLHEARLPVQPVTSANRVLIDERLQPVDLWGRANNIFQEVKLLNSDVSCAEFLSRSSADEADKRLVTELFQGFHAGPIERLSSHALRRADYSSQQMNGEKQFRITYGYGALIDNLAQGIRSQGGRIFLGTELKRVDWEPGSVELTTCESGVHHTLNADATVIALPLGVLKSNDVVFHPTLHEKADAIHGLGFGNVLKIIMVFKERWWTPSDLGLIHSYGEALPTWWSDARGPALIGWAGGPKAENLVGWPLPQLESIALDTIGRLLDEKVSVLRSLLVNSYSHNWQADRHIRGAYSYIPVNGLELPKLLAAPLKETLYFAGEAAVTDAQTGMVFNAYQSGIRAAREILGE